MAEQLLMHIGLSQEGYHEDLLLFQAQPRAAVDIPIQMAPAIPFQVTRKLMPCLGSRVHAVVTPDDIGELKCRPEGGK